MGNFVAVFVFAIYQGKKPPRGGGGGGAASFSSSSSGMSTNMYSCESWRISWSAASVTSSGLSLGGGVVTRRWLRVRSQAQGTPPISLNSFNTTPSGTASSALCAVLKPRSAVSRNDKGRDARASSQSLL